MERPFLRLKGLCIPYIDEAKKTQENKMDLTKHEKYCRLSKAENKLCGRARQGSFCVNPCHEYTEKFFIFPDFTSCMTPELQQPIETPKDPLEVLIEQYADEMVGLKTFLQYESRQFLRKFAEKVRAL